VLSPHPVRIQLLLRKRLLTVESLARSFSGRTSIDFEAVGRLHRACASSADHLRP
jgi:hypothetical protein